ncbi:TPA: hypothetical protein ACTXXA_001328 [Legionella anisa]
MTDVKYILLILSRTSIYYGLIVLLLLFSNILLAQNQFNTPMNALKWLWGPLKRVGVYPGPLVAVNFKYYVMEHFTLELASYGVGGLIGASYIF